MRTFLSLLILALVVTSVSSSVPLYAGEVPAPDGSVWLLKFQPIKVDSIVVDTERGAGRLEWYMLYAITNDGKEPRVCSPFITARLLDSDEPAPEDPLLAEAGIQLNRGTKAVNMHLPDTEKAVEVKYGERFFGPADVTPLRRKALTLKGAEREKAFQKLRELLTIKPKETKRCVATFGPLDVNADVVKIYVHNLTGTIGVKIKDGKRVVEEYVLVLEYRIPGDEFGVSEDRFTYVGRKWIKVERELSAGGKKIAGTKK